MAKTIEIKETSLLLTEDIKLNYANLLIAVINKPVKEGITLKEMRRDLAILKKLEEAKPGEFIEFDDEQIKRIKEETENHLFGGRHVEFEEFGDYIESL